MGNLPILSCTTIMGRFPIVECILEKSRSRSRRFSLTTARSLAFASGSKQNRNPELKVLSHL